MRRSEERAVCTFVLLIGVLELGIARVTILPAGCRPRHLLLAWTTIEGTLVEIMLLNEGHPPFGGDHALTAAAEIFFPVVRTFAAAAHTIQQRSDNENQAQQHNNYTTRS